MLLRFIISSDLIKNILDAVYLIFNPAIGVNAKLANILKAVSLFSPSVSHKRANGFK